MYLMQESSIKDIIRDRVAVRHGDLNVIIIGLNSEELKCENNIEFVTDRVMGNSNVIVSNRSKQSLLTHNEINNVFDPGIYILASNVYAFKEYVQCNNTILKSITYDTISDRKFIHEVADSIFSSMYTKNKKIVFAKDPKVAILYNDPDSRYIATTIISNARDKYRTTS